MMTTLQLPLQPLLPLVKSQTGKEMDGVTTWTTWPLAIMTVVTVAETMSRPTIAPNANVWIPTTLPPLLLPLVLTTTPPVPTGLEKAIVPKPTFLLWPSIARNLATFAKLMKIGCCNKWAKGHCLLVLLYLSLLSMIHVSINHYSKAYMSIEYVTNCHKKNRTSYSFSMVYTYHLLGRNF